MNSLISMYGGLLIPAVAALVLIVLVMKVVGAIARLVSLALLIAVLFGGYTLYGRVSALQKAINAATSQTRAGVSSAHDIARSVGAPARQALSESGLDPSLLRVHIICGGPNTQIQLRYADDHFMFGLLNHYYDVPHDSSIRCYQ